mgnify:CR=1 FL=1
MYLMRRFMMMMMVIPNLVFCLIFSLSITLFHIVLLFDDVWSYPLVHHHQTMLKNFPFQVHFYHRLFVMWKRKTKKNSIEFYTHAHTKINLMMMMMIKRFFFYKFLLSLYHSWRNFLIFHTKKKILFQTQWWW